jgi:Fe2+ transport system protein B
VEDVTIWDLSGTYSYGAMGCSVDSTITQDTAGDITLLTGKVLGQTLKAKGLPGTIVP